MFNQIQVIGRLGQDPEKRETKNGNTVANFSVATSESWTKDGEKQERTEWHKVTAYGKLAEIVAQFCGKGSLVFVSGKIRTESWEKDGEKKFKTFIAADTIKFLDARGENASKVTTADAREANSKAEGQASPGMSTKGLRNHADDIGKNPEDIPF